MSTLFPQHFPRFFKSWSGYKVTTDNGQVVEMSGTQRAYVSVVTKNISSGYQELDQEAQYPFRSVIDALDQVGLDVSMDYSRGNFCLADDGSVYYLDRVVVGRISDIGRPIRQNIASYMNSHHYSLDDLRIVDTSIQRLNIVSQAIRNTDDWSF